MTAPSGRPPTYTTAQGFAGGGRLVALRVVQYATLFLSGLVIARALGPEGRAHYALPLNLALMVWVLAHLSVGQAAARMLGRREASVSELARMLSTFTLALGAAGFALALALGIAARDEVLAGAGTGAVLLAAASVPFTLAGHMAATLLFRIGSLRAFGWINAVAGAVQLTLLVIVAVRPGLTPESALAVALATTALTGIALLVALARRIGASSLVPALDIARMRAAVSVGARLHLSSVAFYLNLRLDLLLVGALVPRQAAGLYSLSVSLADVLYALIAAFAVGALEAQTRADADEAGRYTMDFVRQSIAVTVVATALAAAVAYPLIRLIYGHEWVGSVLPFVILTLAITALAIENPARGLLIRIAPPLTVSAASAGALGVNVALNLALIPPLGISGAAIASLVSYWCAAGLMLGLLSRHTGLPMSLAIGAPRRGDLLPTLLVRVRRELGGRRGAGR